MPIQANPNPSGADNTARPFFEIFANLESAFISNRRAIFKAGAGNYAGDITAWREKQYAALAQLRNLDSRAQAGLGGILKQAVVNQGKKWYNSGKNATDAVIERARKRGAILPAAAIVGGASELLYILNKMLSETNAMTALGRASNEQQYLEIVNRAAAVGGEAENAEELERAIDLAAYDALDKGIVGAVGKSGAQFNISTLGEAVERNGTHKAFLQGQGERAREFGLFYVHTTAHPRSCDLCYPWQNLDLIDDVVAGGKPDGKHELLSTAQEAGYNHYNCMHNNLPTVPGYEVDFSREEQAPAPNEENYGAQQKQRYNERMIREWKRREDGAITPYAQEHARRYKEAWQARQRDLINATNAKHGQSLTRQYPREAVGGKTLPKQYGT